MRIFLYKNEEKYQLSIIVPAVNVIVWTVAAIQYVRKKKKEDCDGIYSDV